jgi:hypothetical protein
VRSPRHRGRGHLEILFFGDAEQPVTVGDRPDLEMAALIVSVDDIEEYDWSA